MVDYNRMVDDVGKGRQSLRVMRAAVVLANGTVYAVLGVVPAAHTIRRVLLGSAVATDITGNAEVIRLDVGDDIDTAAGAGNRVISAVTAFADKKMHSEALTAAVGQVEGPANAMYVLSAAHNAAVVGGDVECIVEYDLTGETYGSYDGGVSSQGTYE